MTKRQLVVMTIFQDGIMAFSINTAATILAGSSTVPDFFWGVCQAFSINVLAGLIIPVAKIGNWFAAIFHVSETTFAHKLLRIFAINAIFVTIISFCMALIHNGFAGNIVSIWLLTYVPLHLVGYITSLIIETPAIKLASHVK